MRDEVWYVGKKGLNLLKTKIKVEHREDVV